MLMFSLSDSLTLQRVFPSIPAQASFFAAQIVSLFDGPGVTRLVCPLCTWLILGRVSWGISLPSTVEQLGKTLWSLKARGTVLLLA